MEKFKKGDRVICIPGFEQYGCGDRKGGSGYIEGKIFIVDEVNSNILWPKDGYGVYDYAVEKITEQKNYEIY